MRRTVLILLWLGSVQAHAVPPPPVQVTADCEAPVYASDVLVCEDAELLQLDSILLGLISQREQIIEGFTDEDSDLDWFRRSRLCAFESDHRDCLLAAYCLRLKMLDPAGEVNQTEWCEPRGDYIAAALFSESGFARTGSEVETPPGRDARISGFVDHQNLFGDDGVRSILGEWWGGNSPDDATWQFNLKAHQDDVAGHSFTVQVPNDILRDDVLRVFYLDARGGQPTRVFLKGVITTFQAPVNFRTRSGLHMELQSSWHIKFGDNGERLEVKTRPTGK